MTVSSAQVIGKLPDFHEVIDRAVAAREGLADAISNARSKRNSTVSTRHSANSRKVSAAESVLLSGSLEFYPGPAGKEALLKGARRGSSGLVGAC